MPIQPYMLLVARELAKAPGARYHADGWMRRFFEHFGAFYLEKYLDKDKI